jgi:molybdopterin-containing oxidoreductase family iron-sulfur binding subunit
MANSKKYWQGFEDLVDSPLAQKFAQNEFAEELPTDEFLGNAEALGSSNTTRRDFLKYLGFSTAAATLAACEAPIIESIPYVVKPDSITPGVPTYYASTFFDGADFAPVLVKTREGRPIKIEPNDLATFNKATNARVQASVLSLYDSARLRQPMIDGSEADWTTAIANLKSALAGAPEGKQVVFMTGTIISPSTKQLVADLQVKYPNLKHVSYDAVSVSNKLDIYQNLLGERSLPHYRFDKATLVVSMAEDFLGDWNGQNVAADYAAARKPGNKMMRHIQLESLLSVTGSNADKRIKLKPSEYGAAVVYLANQVAKATGHAGTFNAGNLRDDLKTQLDSVAAELVKHTTNSIFVAGGNDKNIEHFAIYINAMLGNGDNTVDFVDKSYLRQGSDAATAQLLKDLNAGNVAVLLTSGINPAYSLPGFADAASKAGYFATVTDRMDETAMLAKAVLPSHHYLESWGDFLPKKKAYSLSQPTISPLFNTMQVQDILLALADNNTSYKDYLQNFYETNVEAKAGLTWIEALQNGVVEKAESDLDYFMAEAEFASEGSLKEQIIAALADSSTALGSVKSEGLEIAFYQKTGAGTGTQANNPWLHELPDPITRLCWDNYLTMSAADAKELGFENTFESNGGMNGSYAKVTVNGATIENVPVFIQPGQAQGVVGLAVGYGRTAAGKVANALGVNAYTISGGFNHWNTSITVENTGGEHNFASVQMGHTMMGRKIVNEVSLADFINGDPHEWNHKHVFETYKGPLSASETNLWDDHDHETMHMWNMSIDLNSCIGCGACVVACHIENNVPVVGKQEIRHHRDMHWLRIDRYYSSDMSKEVAEKEGFEGVGLIGNGATDMYELMEYASENPTVVFQPVMCQHCNHAPCETVCPVAATTHSREGLNHMAYNRCIGTRYCANNCPYKVRRFNWFNYMANEQFAEVNPSQDDYGRMVLNPDVTVRARGVMEKCSMCIQRIQYAKLEAKKEGGKIADGSFTTACAQACPTGSISFGDVNNKAAKIVAAKEDQRTYHLLEEVGTQPSVFYQTKVRNLA